MKPLNPAFLSLLFCFSTLFTSAQLFTSNQERVYGNERMINIGFDVANFDGDSVYYPSRQWLDGDDTYCYYPDSVSIFGKEIRVSSEGVYQFILNEVDTVFLNTAAVLGDTSIAYVEPDESMKILSIVSDVSEQVIFEETGSEMVKTFTHQMVDSNDEPVDDSINNYYFKIGETSGLLSFPNFNKFSYFANVANSVGSQVDLHGINPGPGIHDLSTFEIFDFQAGDIIHYEEGSSSFGVFDTEQFALEYLNRTDYADSIVYEVEVTYYINGSMEPEDVWIETRTVERIPSLEIPAGNPIILDNSDIGVADGNFSFLQTHPEFGNAKVLNYLGPLYNLPEEFGCFIEVIDGTCFQQGDAFYYEGLGGPYFQCVQGAPQSSWSTLLYFNKGGEEWGSPLSVNNEIDPEKLTIYPNPATSDFNLRVKGNQRVSSVRLYDLSGRVVREYGVNRALLSLSGISSGIYGVEITFSSGASATKKLVVQ